MTARVNFAESVVEEATLAWFEDPSYAVVSGPTIAPDTSDAECESSRQVVLERWLHEAFVRLNSTLPIESLDDSYRKLALAALRDTLLQKLLSGEIRVKNVGRLSEEAIA